MYTYLFSCHCSKQYNATAIYRACILFRKHDKPRDEKYEVLYKLMQIEWMLPKRCKLSRMLLPIMEPISADPEG